MPELERATSGLRARLGTDRWRRAWRRCCPSVDLVLTVPPGRCPQHHPAGVGSDL